MANIIHAGGGSSLDWKNLYDFRNSASIVNQSSVRSTTINADSIVSTRSQQAYSAGNVKFPAFNTLVQDIGSFVLLKIQVTNISEFNEDYPVSVGYVPMRGDSKTVFRSAIDMKYVGAYYLIVPSDRAFGLYFGTSNVWIGEMMYCGIDSMLD